MILLHMEWLVIEMECPDTGNNLRKGRLLTYVGSLSSDTPPFFFSFESLIKQQLFALVARGN